MKNHSFDYNDILGLITSTIHSTRRHAREINNNLNGLRMACIELDRSSFHMHLKRFIQMAQSSKRLVLPFFNNEINRVKFRHRDDKLNDLKMIQTALHQQDIRLYRSCHISTIRFTIVSYRIDGQKSDGCILFTLAGKPAIGFVVNIIETERKQLLFRIRRISIKNTLYITMNTKQIKCPNVIHGDLEGDGGFVYAKQDSIIEKLIYTYDAKLRCYIFFRVPNLCESS